MTNPAPRTPAPLSALDLAQMEADQIAAHDLKARFDALQTEVAGAGDHHAHLIATYRLIQEIGPVALTELAGRLARQLLTLRRQLQRSAELRLEREKAQTLRESVSLAREAWMLVNGPTDEDDHLQASVREAVTQVRAQLERHRFKGGPLTASLTQPPIIRGGQTPDRYVRLAAGDPQDGTLSQGDATLYVQALLSALLSLKLITTGGALAVSPESLPPYRPLSLAERVGHGPLRERSLIRESFRDGRGERRHRRELLGMGCGELDRITGPDLEDEERELKRLTDQEILAESVKLSRLLAHLKEQDERMSPALPTDDQARALQAEGRSLHFLISTEGNLHHHLWTIWSMGELARRLAAQLQAEEAEAQIGEISYDPASLQLLNATTQVWNLARAWAARHEQLGGLITAPRITDGGRAVLPLCQNVPESHVSSRMRHALHEDDAHLYVAGLKFMIALLGDAPPIITGAAPQGSRPETDHPTTPQGGA